MSSRHETRGGYVSRFDKWYQKATVRASPQRFLKESREDYLYFPPDLVPAATHPLVVARGSAAAQAVMVQRLYEYLRFTVELEHTTVVPITTAIALGRTGLHLPARMREDAFKITTDEAWHAQFSFDLISQVYAATGIVPQLSVGLPFRHRLDGIRARLPADVRGASDILFAVVSETLITAILADFPREPRLNPTVRDVVADHAADEGKHHAYFRSVLEFLWPVLGADQRRQLGPAVPEIVRAFLEPDQQATARVLRSLGLSESDVDGVVADSFPTRDIEASIAKAARSTVRYFDEAGAMKDARTREAFETAGLLYGVSTR